MRYPLLYARSRLIPWARTFNGKAFNATGFGSFSMGEYNVTELSSDC